jgi:hypothetical protein
MAEPLARAGPEARRRTTLLFLAAVALHGLAYLALLPAWMGEDEPWHFEYARHVADGYLPTGGKEIVGGRGAPYDERASWPLAVLQVRRRFRGLDEPRIEATQQAILRSMAEQGFYARVDWAGAEPARRSFDQVAPDFTAASQPPLYYALAGAWLALSPASTIEGDLVWTRALSWLLYVATAWAALAFARQAFDDERVALAAAFAAAWLPLHARQAALVNNDVLARTIATLVLLVCARRLRGRASAREVGLAAALAVAGLFAKSSAAGALLLLAGVLVAGFRAFARRARAIAIACGLALALAAAAWIWHVQHSPVVPRNADAFLLRAGRGLSIETLRELWATFVGAFCWYSRPLPPAAYALAGGVAAVVLAGTVACLARAREGVSRAVVALALAALAVQLALVVLRGVGHGRYLVPAIAGFGVVCAAGLVAWVPEPWRARMCALAAALFVAYDALFLWGGLAGNEWLRWGS